MARCWHSRAWTSRFFPLQLTLDLGSSVSKSLAQHFQLGSAFVLPVCGRTLNFGEVGRFLGVVGEDIERFLKYGFACHFLHPLSCRLALRRLSLPEQPTGLSCRCDDYKMVKVCALSRSFDSI